MNLDTDEFAKLAIEKYGDKVFCCSIKTSQNTLDRINTVFESIPLITQKDFDDYGKYVWLRDDKCPECDADLLGLLGSFSWGIVHGIGNCSHCNKTMFRYYHYINGAKFNMFSLEGF